MSQEIRETLGDWLRAAMSTLAIRPMPFRYDYKLTVDENGASSAHGIEVPDVHALVHSARSQLSGMPETASVLKATLNDPHAADALLRGIQGDDPKLQQLALFTNCLAPSVIRVLQPSQQTSDMETRLEEVYRQLEDYIYRFDELQYRWIIHLTGIKSELESVDLSENVRLRLASSEDQERAFSASHGYSAQPWVRLSGVKPLPPRFGAHSVPLVVIEITEEHRLPRQQPFSEPVRTTGSKVLESLALAGEGTVAGHTIWRDDSCIFADVDSVPEWFDNSTLKFLPYPHYVLSSEKAELLQQIFPLIELREKPDRISLARQRLQYSHDSRFVADPILDCWIGLEALFLPDDNQELKLRAALRIAQYLGESPAERHQIFALAKKSYDARSALAHGNLKQIQKLDEALVTSTRSLLRRAIRQSLLNGHAPRVTELDEALLD